MTPHSPGNRLADEPSLYLRQHAANPVDWWPWCDEAIAEARRRDVPILVSIGYATCYWCHVMERETFEDPAAAEILNAQVVPIKVDREQRPDLDDIHMAACQVFTRLTEGRASGGWPLNAFLHPHTLEPFFVGTYFPPKPMHGRPAFTGVVTTLCEAWHTRRTEVDEQASRIGTLVRHELAAGGVPAPIDRSLASLAIEGLLRVHDENEGGFGGAPKFPQPVYLDLLLAAEDREPLAVVAARRTLDRISIGGIHDQLGGGIHRYAVDSTWTVPHFEKMLYDQAQLASTLAETLTRHPDAWLERLLRRLIGYLEREMTEPDGCFRSAQDAEVDAREGGSFIWTPDEIRKAIRESGEPANQAEELLAFALAVFGFDRGPNFRDPHHPEARPANVLRLADRPEAIAASMGMPPGAFIERLDRVCDVLLDARDRRPQPATDTKVIAAWNGLAIRGIVDAGVALGDEHMISLAGRAADAVLTRLGPVEALRRTAEGDRSTGPAFLDDHAMLADGLLALHAATGDARRLTQAKAIVEAARRRFLDDATGIWFETAAERTDLIVRHCQIVDGAVPSGGGTMMRVLASLAECSDDPRPLDDLHRFLAAVSGTIREHPAGAIRAILSLRTLSERAPDRARMLAGSPTPDAEGDESSPERGEDGVRARLHPERSPHAAVLRLNIPAGRHILAHGQATADTALANLDLEVVTGGSIDPGWPEGRPWRDGLLVHTGLVEVPVRIHRDDPTQPVVIVARWQTCDERRCFRPREVEFAIRPKDWPEDWTEETGADDS